jgi:molecular chaperone GrpE (heat shock protein)
MSDEPIKMVFDPCQHCGRELAFTFKKNPGDHTVIVDVHCPTCKQPTRRLERPGLSLTEVKPASRPCSHCNRGLALTFEEDAQDQAKIIVRECPACHEQVEFKKKISYRLIQIERVREDAPPGGGSDIRTEMNSDGAPKPERTAIASDPDPIQAVGAGTGDPISGDAISPAAIAAHLDGMTREIAEVKRNLDQLTGEFGALKASVEPVQLDSIRLVLQGWIRPFGLRLEALSRELRAFHAERSTAVESKADDDVSAPLEALLEQQKRFLARQEAWLDQLSGKVTGIAHTLVAERATRLKEEVIERLPELFDHVLDECSRWETGKNLNDEEDAARKHVRPVLELLKLRIEDWQRRCGIRQEDPLPRGATATVRFDEDQHDRFDSEYTDDRDEDQTILRVTSVGYRWCGEWLRKPQVIVRTLRKSPPNGDAGTKPIATAAMPSQADRSDRGLIPGDDPQP